MKLKGAIFLGLVILFGVVATTFLSNKNLEFQSNLVELTFENEFDIYVNDGYNEHGTYIINNQYKITHSAYIIGNDYSMANDPAIWRPPGYKFKPQIVDIETPFKISKKKDNDTIKLMKNGKIIRLILKKKLK